MSDDFETLPGTLCAVWRRLEAGVTDRRSPARQPVFATIGPEGPEARVVVLRGADRTLGELRVYTDLRTAKVAHLRADPRASLLFWDALAQFQIRLRVTVTALAGADAAPDWDRLPPRQRGSYGAAPPPGTPIAAAEDARPGADFASFAVLVAKVRAIDTVHLGSTPHRRAMFTPHAGQWLSP